MNDAELERLLGDALRREADAVTPADRLDDLLSEARRRRARTARWPVLAAASAVVALGLGAAWVLTPIGDAPGPLAPSPTLTAASADPTPTPTPDGACTTTEEYRALAAYYLRGDVVDRLVLDRPACGSRTETAVRASLADPASNGLRTLWHPVDRVRVTADGTRLTVDIPDAAWRDDLGAPEAFHALQQVVYAALGAWGTAEDVRFLRGGSPDLGPAFTAVAADGVLGRDQSARAPLWLDVPNGVRVAADEPVVVTGSVVRPPVSYEVVDIDGRTVGTHGRAKVTGALTDQGASAFAISLNLPAGTYALFVTAEGHAPVTLEVVAR